MTREEAIAFFKDMNECTYGNLEAVEMAIKALEQEPKSEWEHDHEILKAYSDGANGVLDEIRAEIDRQEKWLMCAGYNAYNVDIAFNSIKSVLSESEEFVGISPWNYAKLAEQEM